MLKVISLANVVGRDSDRPFNTVICFVLPYNINHGFANLNCPLRVEGHGRQRKVNFGVNGSSADGHSIFKHNGIFGAAIDKIV